MNQKAALRQFLILVPLIFGNSINASAQDDSIYRLPAGTRIHLKMDVELSSKVASVDDTFTATVIKPVIRRDTIVLPEGAIVQGRVTSSSAAAGGVQDGSLEVVFDTVKLGSDPERKIDGRLVTKLRPPRSSSVPTVLSILGGTAAGAVIGGLSHRAGGALIGAGIGAGAGGAIAYSRKGEEIRIRKDEEFEIELRREVFLPVRDY